MIRFFLDKKNILFLLLLVFFSVLFLYKIGVPSVFEEDEAKMAEISREILVTNKFIDIQHNFSPNFHKPPLYNWVTVAAFNVFGMNEFSVRLGAALFGLGTIMLTFFLAGLIFDKKIALLSSFILGSSILFLSLNRVGLVDTGLTFFVSLTFLLFLISYLNKKRKAILILTGFTMALGFLTKGPLGLILPATTIFCYLLYKKDFFYFKYYFKEIFFAFLIFLVVGLPWWIFEYMIHGNLFLQGLFGKFMFGIYFNEFQKHAEPIYFYLIVLLIGMLPWSFHSFYSLLISFKKEFRNKAIFFLIWFFIVFVLFSLAKTKIPSYILPLFPPLAIISAMGINNLLTNKKKIFLTKFLTLVGWCYFLLCF
ncbi:MAG: glycosyltransferase family 39 protein [Candidatus Margulisiibacteriota bacterium]|jgi:4-amino-4-deoxy-L-arabinose transferase-like glycosyltransferase